MVTVIQPPGNVKECTPGLGLSSSLCCCPSKPSSTKLLATIDTPLHETAVHSPVSKSSSTRIVPPRTERHSALSGFLVAPKGQSEERGALSYLEANRTSLCKGVGHLTRKRRAQSHLGWSGAWAKAQLAANASVGCRPHQR